MSVPSWDYPTPFSLLTPLGTLELNQEVSFLNGTGYYFLDPGSCSWSVPLRLTNTNIPQKDGSQLHDRFYEGAEMVLSIQLWQTRDDLACDALLTDMVDTLRGHLRTFTRPELPPNDNRIFWTPDGAAERMLKWVKLNETVEQTNSSSSPVTINATFKSYYPYSMDAEEEDDVLDVTIINTGTAEFWPVIRVTGPANDFIITNNSVEDDDGNPLLIEYDSSQTGASDIPGTNYVEIDMFQETMYLGGNPAGANFKPGLVMSTSTFFPLQVGTNDLTISGAGAGATILWQNAYG